MSAQPSCSVAESIASRPVSDREEILRGLSEDEALAILYDWKVWARPNQLPPAGSWEHWLLLAGRGFGKTKTGGECVREWAAEPLPAPIHLIAPTASDIRNVMIEGPSGILSCYPPMSRPLYQPSQRHKLTWPNGNVAYGFSADEPERLRGPQCISGDALVRMADGTDRELSAIKRGDYVLTRSGPRRVLRAWMSSHDARVFRLSLLDGRSIIATGDHRVCVTRALNGTGGCGTRNQGAVTTRRGCFSIEKSGKPAAGRFQTGTTFTTLTAISTIIASKTSNCSAAVTITDSTAERSSLPTKPSPRRQRIRPKPRSGGNALRPGRFTVSSAARSTAAAPTSQRPTAHRNASTGSGPESFAERTVSALNAASRIEPVSEPSGIADGGVMPLHVMSGSHRSGVLCALTVEPNLPASGPMRDSAGRNAPALSTTKIVSVEPLSVRLPVHDLEIEGAHEFFANGILVHNCCRYWADELAAWRYPVEAWDNLMFGFRIGDELRGVITTTPKPIKLLKELLGDPSVTVTRGSTYENKANLAPAFFRTIVKKYEGTRLGRQELLAELLEDVPGALWKRSMIEACRIRATDIQWDKVVRTVVAIDPSVSHTEEADECGIVVAALVRSGHALILDDLSCREMALSWAKIAVSALFTRKADRIVAEVNNGGDLVETTLRIVNPNIPYRAVWAAKGKEARAEPVAALYEQGRVHHVGSFAYLEDELCTFVPGTGQKSPNRLDALVWALTDLYGLDGQEDKGNVVINPMGSYQISPV